MELSSSCENLLSLNFIKLILHTLILTKTIPNPKRDMESFEEENKPENNDTDEKTNVPLLFDQSIQKLNVLFKFSGMNIKNKIKNTTDVFKYRWLYTFNFVWVFSAVVASFYYIIVGMAQGMDFMELTSVAPCLTFSILAMFKSIFYLTNESEVFNLIQSLQDLEHKNIERNQSDEKEKIIKEDRDFLNAVINVLYFLNCSMIIVFDLSPLILIAVKYYRTNEFEMLLPYLDVFIFIPYEFKYWPFAYIHQIWSECVVLLEMAAADYLFFTCCTYIKIQFRLLKHDFETIVPKSTDRKDTNVLVDVNIKRKLVQLIKWHQDLIESSNKLETIYSKSNLFNFLSSSLVICLTGFNVTIVDDIVVVVTFVTFLFMALLQVFFLCFFADMLMTASTEVGDGVYNCRWYDAQHIVVKELHLVQTRALKPCKLTAMGFAEVNLRAFMRVLSTSWSYFALLQSVYGNE